MIQQEKDLLIKDLCARLPYGVKGIEANSICLLNTPTYFKSLIKNIEYRIDHLGFKPYLFPLSSMTEEELREYDYLYAERENNNEADDIEQYSDLIDWFNKRHFDYRGLIEKSLALDATNLNIY